MTNNNNIYKDTTTGRTWRIRVCYKCPSDEYPKGKPVLPEDTNERLDEKGDVICGECQKTDLNKQSIALFGPNRPQNKRFIEEEQRRINDWNNIVYETKQKTGMTHLKTKRNRYEDEINNYNIRELYKLNRGTY